MKSESLSGNVQQKVDYVTHFEGLLIDLKKMDGRSRRT